MPENVMQVGIMNNGSLNPIEYNDDIQNQVSSGTH